MSYVADQVLRSFCVGCFLDWPTHEVEKKDVYEGHFENGFRIEVEVPYGAAPPFEEGKKYRFQVHFTVLGRVNDEVGNCSEQPGAKPVELLSGPQR